MRKITVNKKFKPTIEAIVIALLVILAIWSINPQMTAVFSAEVKEKNLPIYCVDTTEKKVAISFDAA